MNELEQTLPEETQDETRTAKQETVVADLDAPGAALDITMGDMETDLPTASSQASADGAADAESSADEDAASLETEMEIPWGDMSLTEETEEQADEQETATQPQAALETAAPGESEAEAEAPILPTRRVWYVVHCYSGYENKVKKGLEQRINSMNLQDRIFRVVVPVEREVEIREGQRKNIERRVFPGYILVEMMELIEGVPSSDEVWYAVRNTPGVTGFVSSGDLQRPVPLRQEEVDKILKRMESEEPKVHVTFRVGQTVHIIDGPFADFRGNVDAVDMVKGKVRVLVSFFGRETPVELDLLQVEKV